MSVMQTNSSQWSRIIFAVLISWVLVTSHTVQADSTTPEVSGKSIGEWSVKWWQWSLSIPAANNPMLDNSGAFCNVRQQGPVWFLAGVFFGVNAERHCTIPHGKSILFPIANAFWINSALDDPNNTEADYRRLASESLPAPVGSDLEATLNGKSIVFNPDTPIVRSQSPVFTARFPADNVFGMNPDLLTGFPIVSDGFWVMLPPLARGSHVLHFRAALAQDVTYYLTIR